jgi:hypothetical protein
MKAAYFCIGPIAAIFLSVIHNPAIAQCRLCATADAKAPAPPQPLQIDIETLLDFAIAAHDGRGNGGSIWLDERTGVRRVQGLVDLGGASIRGTIRLSGAPFARVSVSLPGTTTLTAADGSTAEVRNLRADMSTDPQLDANGKLDIPFGGRVVVRRDASGEFRGRIAVTADYR